MNPDAATLIALIGAALAVGWIARFSRRAVTVSRWIDFDAPLQRGDR